MRFRMKHKETGEFAIGVYEPVPAMALASEFTDIDGKISPEYEGGSEMWWDEQAPEEDAGTGEISLVTESHDTYPESEFERVPVEEE